MLTEDHARYQARAKIIKALAHPTRLFLVEELSRSERCVCDLTDMVNADMSTVSKHLSILKAAGLVQDRRQGTSIFYSITTPCVLNFLGCVESIFRESAQHQLTLV